MSQTQHIKESKADNNVSATVAPETQANVDAPSATAPTPKASILETLREVGTAWAEAAVGFGKTALVNVAHALERTADRLGSLQEKLKKGESAIAASS
jgi:hypothetical protein